MRFAIRMIVGTTLLAVALIASSWLLKGDPAGDWVDAALYLALCSFFASQIVFAVRQPLRGDRLVRRRGVD